MTAEDRTDIRAPAPARRDEPGGEPGRPLPAWKKLLLGLAGLLVVAGLVLQVAGCGGSAPAAQQRAGELPEGALGASNLAEGGGTPRAAGEEPGWSPAMVKMGFSFFVGFALGFLLRTFLKLVALGFGLVFLVLLGLQQVELITVNWEAMERVFDGLVANVRQEAGAIETFLTGSLPAAGLGTLGLVTGFRRN